jgi:hypothetical protein
MDLTATLADGQTATKPLELTLNCGTPSLTASGSDSLGEFAVPTGATVISDLDDKFVLESSCTATFSLTSNDNISGWLTFDSNAKSISFDEATEDNLGTYDLLLTVTLENGVTLSKQLFLYVTDGCTSPFVVLSASTKDLG